MKRNTINNFSHLEQVIFESTSREESEKNLLAELMRTSWTPIYSKAIDPEEPYVEEKLYDDFENCDCGTKQSAEANQASSQIGLPNEPITDESLNSSTPDSIPLRYFICTDKNRYELKKAIEKANGMAVLWAEKAVHALKHVNRSPKTARLFLETFKINPDIKFEDTNWETGNLVRHRINLSVTRLLKDGWIRIYCDELNGKNTPKNQSVIFQIVPKRYSLYLGAYLKKLLHDKNYEKIAAYLLISALSMYFKSLREGKYKLSAPQCYVHFILALNGVATPSGIAKGCREAKSHQSSATMAPSKGRDHKTDAEIVLKYIKDQAQERAKRTVREVSTSSKFYRRLVSFYLKDYLKDPSPINGEKAAVQNIGKTFTGTVVSELEKTAKDLSKQPIPEAFRKIRAKLPKVIEAATDILSRTNISHLPYMDIPHLLGVPNTDTTFEADWKGGKNWSQLLHWGTGVKYSDIDKLTMRELFLAYEMWHLEQWDIFGQDPINDLIAEEAGRILGSQLRKGNINPKNLQTKLNEGFSESRAWVGSLLRARQKQLDEWTLAETQPASNFRWGTKPEWKKYAKPWGTETITSQLKSGKSIDDVKKWNLTSQIIDLYTLIYESIEWEKVNGVINNGDLINSMLSGKLDYLFKRLAKE